MKALAMPSSSRTADDRLSACFCAKSPRMREERSATAWRIFACSSWSGCCISHDAIGARRARGATCIVKVMQMGYRLAHREEGLVEIQPTLRKQRCEEVPCALRLTAQRSLEQLELVAVVFLQLGDTSMRAAEWLAMRR